MFIIPFLFDRVFCYDSVTKYFMRKVLNGFPFHVKMFVNDFKKSIIPPSKRSGQTGEE